MPSLATFNANNLFLRYKFMRNFPGAHSTESEVEAAKVGLLGYLPETVFGRYPPSSYVIWDADRRVLLARALKERDGQLPDILCLQEVENIQAIRALNEHYLDRHYPYSLLIDGHDSRNIDVGFLSCFPIREIRSQVDELGSGGTWLFSRDCLEAQIELPGGEAITVLVNHLKSKFVDRPDDRDEVRRSHERRMAQAEWIASYVHRRFEGQHTTALYAVVGDFNDTPESPWLAALVGSPHLTDLLSAHRPLDNRWTYYYRAKNQVSQLDHVLASRGLADRVSLAASDPAKAPYIVRDGVGYRELNADHEILPERANLVHFEDDGVTPVPPSYTPSSRVPFRFDRYPEVKANWKRNISDHCPVKIWF